MISYRLEIYKLDASLYWREHFNSLEELQKWFTEEQTRPYWNPEYTHQVFELDDQGSTNPISLEN